MPMRRSVAALLPVVLLLCAAGCASRGGDAVRTSPVETGTRVKLGSTAFADREAMPAQEATSNVRGGRNESPPLAWSGEPETTRSFALIIVDRHPIADDYVHWAVVDIPPSVHSLPAAASPRSMPRGADELAGTNGQRGYHGPSPPPGSGAHDYEITLYALDVPRLDVPVRPSVREFADAVEGHMLAYGTLTGTFER